MKKGKIAWTKLITDDVPGAIEFYTSLFGWETEKLPMSQGEYTMFKHDGQAFGGVLAAPRPDLPPHWTDYVIVECASRSGKTCMGSVDIPDVGRIAVIPKTRRAPRSACTSAGSNGCAPLGISTRASRISHRR